jgi:prolyl-tRNA synthetase
MKAVALMRTDGQPLMAMLAGNKNLSIPKLSRLSGHQYRMATDSEIESCFKSVPGFVGPVERDGICQILWDRSLKSVTNGVCGANRKDYHYTQVAVTANNFGIEAYVDIAAYEIGERCPVCGGEMALTKGEQLYQTIAYGTSLSEIHRANYLDAAGKAQRHWGLGLTFDMMAGIKSVVRHHICSEFTDIKCAEIDSEETAHMQIGIEALLPFDIWLIVMNVKKASQCELAEAVYDRLTAMGIRVMYDDRSDSPGIKFFDAEQLGNLPRIVVGKSAEEGLCNLQTKSEQFGPMTLEEVLHWVINH